MRAPGAGRLVAAGALAAALAACGPPEAFRIGAVRAAPGFDGAAIGETGIDAPALESAAGTALEATGFRRSSGPAAQVATVGIASLRVLPGTPGPKGEIKVEIALGPAEGGASPTRREAGVGTAPLLVGVASPMEGWRRALGEAAQGAAEALAIGARADGKTVDGLVADLSSRDERVRDQAVRVLGERRSRAAVPALVGRLRTEEPRIAMRIVGALAQIGDERAVPVLIELSRGTDAVATARLVRFIGDIGGPEAEGYLLTLESGHADPRVRRAAREALDDLAARSQEQAAVRKGR